MAILLNSMSRLGTLSPKARNYPGRPAIRDAERSDDVNEVLSEGRRAGENGRIFFGSFGWNRAGMDWKP